MQGATPSEGRDTLNSSKTLPPIQDAVAKFTGTFYQTLRTRTGNLVSSPLGASTLLTLAWLGATKASAQEIEEALRLPSDKEEAVAGFRQLLDSIQVEQYSSKKCTARCVKKIERPQLKFISKLYTQENYNIKEEFRKNAANGFEATVEGVDFIKNAENTRKLINEWVEKNTNGKIKDLFPLGALTSESRLLLVNTIYFKASWCKPFEESETISKPFYISETKKVFVDTMHGTLQLHYGHIPQLGATVLAIPYAGDLEIDMTIVLPDSVDGLKEIEDRIEDVNFNEATPEMVNVRLTLPKFRIEAKLFLKEEFEKLGIKRIFGTVGELDNLADGNIFVSDIIQNIFIQVDEKGTEAAVAGGVNIQFVAKRDNMDIQVDHPFLFALKAKNVILFIGRVIDPSENLF